MPLILMLCLKPADRDRLEAGEHYESMDHQMSMVDAFCAALGVHDFRPCVSLSAFLDEVPVECSVRRFGEIETYVREHVLDHAVVVSMGDLQELAYRAEHERPGKLCPQTAARAHNLQQLPDRESKLRAITEMIDGLDGKHGDYVEVRLNHRLCLDDIDRFEEP